MASLKREAEKLRSVDAVAAYEILGGLASLTFDDDEVDRNHRAAIALSDSSVTHYDYAVSLQFVLRRNDAANEAVTAASMDPLDLDLARTAVKFLSLAGRLQEALAAFEKLRVRFPQADVGEVSNLPEVIATLARWDIDESAIQNCQRIAFDFLRQRKIKASGASLDTTSAPRDEMLMYSIYLDMPREEVIRLDEELTEHIWEATQFPGGKQFWIGFEQFKRHEQQAA